MPTNGNGKTEKCPPHTFEEEDIPSHPQAQCTKCGITYEDMMKGVDQGLMEIRAQLDKGTGKEN